MSILVTGGVGVIGQTLCRSLLSAGNNVICVDDFSTGFTKTALEIEREYPEQFMFFEENVESDDFISLLDDPVFSNVTQIYHLACPASPPHYQKDPVRTMMTNVLGTKNVLDFAKKKNATILFTSTSEVYGDPEIEIQSEKYRGNVNCTGPRACYDEGKRAAESLCFDYHRMYKTKVRVVRIFNTYGPGMDPNDGRVVSNFIMQALKGEQITVYGHGTQTRSFCFVDDMVSGLEKMMNQSACIGPVNLGNPHEITINELLNTIIELLNFPSSSVVNLELPEDDPLRRRPDISLAKENLGWHPSVSLKEGLRKTISYFEGCI